MLKLKLTIFLAVLLIADAIHLNNHEAAVDLPAGTVNLIADNGQAIKRCNNCGPGASPDSASISPYQPSDKDQVWSLEVVGSQVAFKGSNGKYLARCNGCWRGGAYSDSAFVHANGRDPWSLWTPVLHANGKYSFRADSGRFLTRCNRCVRGGKSPNFVFVHEAIALFPWAQWDVVYTNLPKLGRYTFQADNSQFLKFSPTVGGASPTAASVQAGSGPDFLWKLTRIGTKVAIQGSNGNYLSRCNRCWSGGAYPDSAFVHLNTPNEPYSQWTPVSQPDGKWAFQADTGKYLARCNGCASSSAPNLAFVHSTNPPAEPWATWKLAPA